MASIADLFAHNRAWAAQMERERPGFFTVALAAADAASTCGSAAPTAACRPTRSPASSPARCSCTATSRNVVVHSDLNALSAIQFAVDDAEGRAHHGRRPLRLRRRAWPRWTTARIGLADNWIRHIQDVRDRHRGMLDNMPAERRVDALVDLNVIEQVVNVCAAP